MASTGIDDPNLFEVFVKQMVNVTADGDQPDQTALNGMLAVVRGIEPRDHIEAMLAIQMAAVHNATMTYARRLNQSATLAQIDSAEKALNKLARTFTTQMDTLKRYRSGGQQTVIVQHVNVNDSG